MLGPYGPSIKVTPGQILKVLEDVVQYDAPDPVHEPAEFKEFWANLPIYFAYRDGHLWGGIDFAFGMQDLGPVVHDPNALGLAVHPDPKSGVPVPVLTRGGVAA